MTLFLSTDAVTLHHGDTLAELRRMPDSSAHAVICDPPYGLGNPNPAYVVTALERWFAGERDHVPDGRGFMGRDWDAFVPPPAVWDECLRVLVPGGHLAVFAGSRTIDLMGLSIRLAGFEMRDGLAAWLYGSGMPKSLDVGKALDKAAGATREVVGSKLGQPGYHLHGGTDGSAVLGAGITSKTVEQRVAESSITAPATDAAREWSGYGTALKPAHEPILLARKPLSGTVAANVLAHRAGAINVNATRIGTSGGRTVHTRSAGEHRDRWDGNTSTGEVTDNGGRWPTNVVLAHHPECGPDEAPGPCVPGCQVAALDEQSGVLHSHPGTARRDYDGGWFGGSRTEGRVITKADEGGASRFFPTFRYQAKAPKSERPLAWGKAARCACEAPRPLDLETGALPPRWRQGTVCATCERPAEYRGHPTVKPRSLVSWLVDLLVVPGGTVLDCFAGSGPLGEVVAARGDGTRAVLVERDEHSCRLIAARLGVTELPRSAPRLSPDPDAVILCDDDDWEEPAMSDPKIEATDDNTVELYSLADRVGRYRKAKLLEKAAKEAAEEARADIAAFLDEHEAEFGTLDGELVIRWRQVTSNRLDTKKLRESHPDIADEFTRPTTAMRMEIVGGESS